MLFGKERKGKSHEQCGIWGTLEGIAAADVRKSLSITAVLSNANHKSGNSEADTRGKSAGHQIQENKNHR